MSWIRTKVYLSITMVIVACAAPHFAAAQVAPTGGHYAGRASDTGFEPGAVNASGGFGASVPLDLPPARGGLPIPVQINFGAAGVGAAGLGWEIPLSYVRRDTSFAGRRPARRPDANPEPRAQVFMSLLGRTLDLVPKGQDWVARHNAPEILLREQNGTWLLFDGRGHTYVFTAPAALNGAGVWFLSSITGQGGTAVQLHYEITPHALQGGTGLSIDLVNIEYNSHPTAGCTKHEVTLTYGPDSALPLSLSMLADRVITRMRTLTAVDVKSREDCGFPGQRLRRYEFTYLPDVDTQQPRLRSVQLFGRQGTPEENTSIVVASYVYGSATSTGALRYQKTQSIALPAGVDPTKISSTQTEGVNAPSGGVGYATWQSLTDVTGDGRPEMIFPKNGKLWVARNRPGNAGSTMIDVNLVAQLSDAILTTGAFETRTATNNRFSAASQNIDEVWRQAIDVNGDGRIDIIDAAEEPNRWVIYLNTPDTGASGVKWVRRSYSIARLHFHLTRRGHQLPDDYVPLARRFTGRDRAVGACWISDGTSWQSFPQGFNNGSCGSIPNQLLSTGPEETFTEWEVADINRDGYPDVVMNSSHVDVVSLGGPVYTAPAGQTANTQLHFRVQPVRGDQNNVDAMLNVVGVLVDDATSPFSAPITLRANTKCGVALWAETGGTQDIVCGIADINGDGLTDRVENRRQAYLGTGRGFSSVHLTLPGSYATQESAQVQTCVVPEPDPPGQTSFGAAQSVGMRDLTGDGIPDFIGRSGATWRVSIGTGTGFAEPIDIDVSGGSFSFSSQTERCDGKLSSTKSGLYDVDGDGRPEVVRVNGTNLDVFQLSGGTLPGTPESGRLVKVENGFGARTVITYRSAKEDGITAHQVPFPEIVVTSVETIGTKGFGGTLAATRYAYGNTELMFDTVLDAFTLPGYGRSVELRVVPVREGVLQGRAVLTETYALAPFAPTPKNDRFGRYLRAGRVRDVTVLAGTLGDDPWPLLGVDTTADPRRIAAAHYDWATKIFEEPAVANISPLDCMEVSLPYDFAASFGNALGSNGYDVCSSHGFVYGLATESWRGDAAPPSTANVETRSEVREIDDFGRMIVVLHQKDRHRGDDDICVETRYATPTGNGSPILSAPASRIVSDCRRPNLPTYAAQRWTYDNLPAGNVSEGLVTSNTVERRTTDDGTLLKAIRVFVATYDAAANLKSITTTREDGASRRSLFEYDTFGLVPVRQRLEATGTPPIEVKVSRDPITLDAMSTTDSNQTARGADFDGFGRLLRSTIAPPGGSPGVLSTLTYIGFSGIDPLGRRIVSKTFTDPVTPGTEDVAAGYTGTIYLDELGRERRIEVALGEDYGKQTLILSDRSYDTLGRAAFEADPFPSTEDPLTAYGTTAFFRADGTPSCFIRGKGPQHLTSVTDEAAEKYPTCFSRSFNNHQELLSVRDASSNLATAPQAGVAKVAALTAVGRVVSRSTVRNNVRLEHATFDYDRLGQLTGFTRYQDPVGATNPVQSTWRLDSLGRTIEWHEPESAMQFSTFSDWGELLDVRWTDSTTSPATEVQLVNTYDALGRLTHREERRNGVVDPDAVNDYIYDQSLGTPPQINPTHLLGRLAQAKASTGSVFLSFDTFGRVNARAFTDTDNNVFVEKSFVHTNGAPDAIELFLPDTGYKRERIEYRYDSASRLRVVTFRDQSGNRELYSAATIDPLGHVRKAKYAGIVDYGADFAETGRRLLKESTVSSASGARRFIYLSYDPLGRERVRREIKDGALTGPKTNSGYDALSRLSMSLQTDGWTTLANWQFTYDSLGNLMQLTDAIGSEDATLSYRTGDRDRVCRIGYGNAGLGGTVCNLAYDAVGNIVEQPTRTGIRRFSYFANGNVRTIDEQTAQARFRYDAFGGVQELDVTGPGVTDVRRDRRYGGLVEISDQIDGGSTTSVITRRVPGAGGMLASRRGSGNDWIFQFGEGRGNRFFTDATGAFVQDVAYQPYGEAQSSGAAPGSPQYTRSQWNGGDALAAFGLSHLGARLYDPVIGRFLSRDPLLVLRTATTTNAYAFAANDPLNLSDPSGADWGCIGKECQGPVGLGFPFPFGFPGDINPPGLYFPPGSAPAAAEPQAAYRPPIPTVFSSAPKGPQTAAGRALKEAAEDDIDFEVGDNFNFDTLAATGTSVEATVELLENTQDAQRSRDKYNARLNSFGSFFAGVGDSVWFWCPGCAANARRSWGIKSGDADSWSYGWGSVTGIVGSFALPHPTSVTSPTRARPGGATPGGPPGGGGGVNPTGTTTNCAQCAIALDATLAGRPASALPKAETWPWEVAQEYGRNFVMTTGPADIRAIAQGWGPGGRGIIFAERAAGDANGHFFNVVNQNGVILFLEGQGSGIQVIPNAYDHFYDVFSLMQTR